LPCVPITWRGLRIRESVVRLMALKANQGVMDGPAISKENGNSFLSRAIDDSLFEVLEDWFGSNQNLFPPNFDSTQDLRKSYQVFRTLQRTSDTQALETKVSKNDIDVVNCWAGVEKAQGQRPGHEMRHYYADITLLLKPFQRYTEAM
jgi:integrase